MFIIYYIIYTILFYYFCRNNLIFLVIIYPFVFLITQTEGKKQYDIMNKKLKNF